ncbi:hypothetical protein MyChFU_32840 [Mycobacterium intracellulare subsp. chimaera]
MNCWPIRVNTGLSDAAANTITFPDACGDCAGGRVDPHPTTPASNTAENNPVRNPIRRMDAP